MYEIEQIRNLFTKIESLNLQKKDTTNFNIFHVLGVEHYELWHSTILKEFLNVKESHDFKNDFLDYFVNNYINDNKFFFNTKNANIRQEEQFDNGRIDLLIESEDRNTAIIVENKIYAPDQSQQLQRYDEYARRTYNDYKIVYLSLFGTEPTEDSKGNTEPILLSYKEHILKWLESCIQKSAEYPAVRESLIMYKNLIKDLTMNDENNEKILDVLCESKNLEYAEIIVSQITNAKERIIKEKLIPILNGLAREKDLLLGNSDAFSNKRESGFWFYKENWDFAIYFCFEHTGYRNFFYGITKRENIQTNVSFLDKIRNLNLENKDNFWATWEYLKEIKNWDATIFEDIIQNKEESKVVKEIKKYLEEKLDLLGTKRILS